MWSPRSQRLSLDAALLCLLIAAKPEESLVWRRLGSWEPGLAVLGGRSQQEGWNDGSDKHKVSTVPSVEP